MGEPIYLLMPVVSSAVMPYDTPPSVADRALSDFAQKLSKGGVLVPVGVNLSVREAINHCVLQNISFHCLVITFSGVAGDFNVIHRILESMRENQEAKNARTGTRTKDKIVPVVVVAPGIRKEIWEIGVGSPLSITVQVVNTFDEAETTLRGLSSYYRA